MHHITFDTDVCGGNSCDLLSDLVDDYCMLFGPVNNYVIENLGGFNKVTNNCPIQFSGNGFDSDAVNNGSNRQIVFHKYAKVRSTFPWSSLFDMPYQEGIFLSFSGNDFPSNKFYTLKFDLHQIIPYGCTVSSPFTFVPFAPTIYFHTLVNSSDDIRLRHGQLEDNVNALGTENLTGFFTVHGQELGVYTSPEFFIDFYEDESNDWFIQLAFRNGPSTAGTCDDPPVDPVPNEGNGNNQPAIQNFGATLMDNIVIDCDRNNIVFSLNVELCNLKNLTQCDSRSYCATLQTDCPNININNYPYSLHIYQGNTVVKSIEGTGYNTNFTLDELPTGEYRCRIQYNTANGYNVRVMNEGFNEESIIQHVQNGEYIINGNETINSPAFVPATLVVKSGAVLRVHDIMRFTENASLIIEPDAIVEVSGLGHLTSCQNRWPGVAILQNGRIEVIQNGTISNAVTGITHNTQGNAVIQCLYGHFENNLTSIHAYRKAQLSVHNTGFNGGIRGVILEYTEGNPTTGTTFTGNSFAYMEQEGILAYSAPIVVRDGNEFYGCDQGVVVRNLFGSPVVSTVSGVQAPNEFIACRHGVYGNAAKFIIEFNLFNQNDYGNIISGFNSFQSKNNTFFGFGYGETLYDSGENSNFSNNNQYNTHGGLFAFGNNYNYKFERNCFNTMYFDANTWGYINQFQGTSDIAASNCFTGNNIPDMYCNTDHTVEYYIPKASTQPPACMIPVTQGNYTTEESFSFNSSQCGINNTNYISEYDYIFTMGCDSSRLHTLIQQLRQLRLPLLVKLKQNTITLEERRTLNWVERHLRIAINQWAWCLRRRNEPQRLIQWFKEQDNIMEYRLQAVEAFIEAKEYENALVELDSVYTQFTLSNVIYDALILTISAEREDTLKQIPDVQDIQKLKNAAALSDPYAVFARALLHKLTKEHVEPEINYPFEPRTRKDVKNEHIVEKVKISPNPTTGSLKLEILDFKSNVTYSYRLYNLFGQIFEFGQLSQVTTIDLENIKSGYYFIEILNNEHRLEIQKVIKL